MRVAIDISQTVYGTGVSVYTKKLVENLLKIDPENEYLLFGGSLRRIDEMKQIANGFRGNFTRKIFPIPPSLADFVWNRLHILPVEKLIGKIDVFHSSDWAEPPSSAFKVTTVHDLYPLKFPRLVNKLVREVHERKLNWVIKESRRIIVPSESTMKDLITLGINEARIKVIPEAPALEMADQNQVEAVKRKYGIKGEYLISVGVTKLKNTKNIIKGFDLAKAGKNLKLVLIGRPVDTNIPEVRNVRRLGHVLQDDMGALMTGSKGLIFASLYEGFGLPILDAFACGVPVITSGIGSMSEVAGNAAVLVDPYDVNSIAEGILKALRGPKGLVAKGNERVKQFSWENTARMTLEVYREAER